MKKPKITTLTPSNEKLMKSVEQFGHKLISNYVVNRKKDILEICYDKVSLFDLSEKTGMSLPLISFHINGNFKNPGLFELGFISKEEVKAKVYVKTTDLGNKILKYGSSEWKD